MRFRRLLVLSAILAVILLVGGVLSGGAATTALADSPGIVDGQVQDGDGGSSAANAELAQASFLAQLMQVLSPANMTKDMRLLNEGDVQPSSPTTAIDFDNVSAPCAFASTTALRGFQQAGWFLGYGNDGGGILDDCAGFGVSAHSGSNFLAFNPGATYSDGGIPQTPTAVIFDASHSQVNVQVASGNNPGHLTALIALRSWTIVEDMEIFYTTSGWTNYTLTGSNIRGLWIVSLDPGWVIDDITFGPTGQPDLLIECQLTGPSCPPGDECTISMWCASIVSGAGTCTITYTVGNHGTASAGPSTTRVTIFDSPGSYSADQPTPSIPAGGSVTLTTVVTTGLAWGCPYVPDLHGELTVDVFGVVPESNEGNNTQAFFGLG